MVKAIGFKDITGPMRSSWKLKTCFGKVSAGVIGKSELEELWGTDRPGKRIRAFSPKLGWGTVVCADFGRRRVLWSSGVLRACEVINRYRAYHWVEVFFRRCKHTLAMGKMALRGRGGAWASVCVPLLAYCLVLVIQKDLRMGFDQICAHLRKLAVEKHLHGGFPLQHRSFIAPCLNAKNQLMSNSCLFTPPPSVYQPLQLYLFVTLIACAFGKRG